MFYRIFNKTKYRSVVRTITLILLTGFIITINGCTTTSTTRYTGEKIAQNNAPGKITSIVLKNGKKINTKGKKIVYADSIKSLMILNFDTVVTGKKLKLSETDKQGVYDTIKSDNIKSLQSGKNTIIPLKDILEIFTEKTETDVLLTSLFITGVIAGVALTTILLKNATEPDGEPATPPLPPEEPPPPPPPDSCPLVFSFDGEKYVFDGEPLSGVIAEGLTRTDYARMEILRPSEGKFRLLIRNQPNETEMLDEIKLVCIPHDESTFITPNSEGEFYNYKTMIHPETVTDENGNDICIFFKEKDDIRWQTLMPVDTAFAGNTDKHKLTFRFPKPEGAENALIFINCGTASWGGNMIGTFLQLKGDKIDEWYKGLFPGGKELQKLYMFLGREELFTMNVNLLEGDRYTAKTLIHAGGPYMDEDRIIELNLKKAKGNFVEFQLNPPPGFWKIDQIGIIYDYKIIEKENIKQLDAVYAKDQDGIDIMNEINKADKNYYRMPEEGNYSNIYFDVPADFRISENEIFIKATGYYEIKTDRDKSEQTELVNELMNTPGKITEYSMMLYRQNVKQISDYLNRHGKK